MMVSVSIKLPLILLLFPEISANCVKLFYTARYSIENEFDFFIFGNFSVKNNTYFVEPFNKPPFNATSNFQYSILKTVINDKVLSCPQQCKRDVISAPFFINGNFIFNKNNFYSLLLMAVADAGSISFAKGNIIEHNRIYEATQHGKKQQRDGT